MTKRTMMLGLLAVMGMAVNAAAGQRGQCCDPVPAQLQAMCCQGTLLPYHVALKRADDATRAEAALAATTKDRDDLRAQLAQLKSELQSAVALRDKAQSDAEASAKNAKASQAEAVASKQATEAANKAKQAAEAVAAQTKADAAKQIAAAKEEAKLAGEQAKAATSAKDLAVAAEKKATETAAELKQKLDATLKAAEDKPKEDKPKEEDPKSDDDKPKDALPNKEEQPKEKQDEAASED